jgi:hypothetical protein
MSTAATLVEIPITVDTRTYARLVKETTNKEGQSEKEYKIVGEDALEEFQKANKDYTFEFKQSFGLPHGNTTEALKELFTDKSGVWNEKEQNKQTNNANDVKLGNKSRQLMLSTDADGNDLFPQEGTYDLREYISQSTTTRGSTALEKMMVLLSKTLDNLPPDQRAQLKAYAEAQFASKE